MRSFARIALLIVLLTLSVTKIYGFDKQDTKKAPPQGSTAVMIEPAFTINPAKTAVRCPRRSSRPARRR